MYLTISDNLHTFFRNYYYYIRMIVFYSLDEISNKNNKIC